MLVVQVACVLADLVENMEACTRTYVRTITANLLVDRVEFSEEGKKSRWPALNACTKPEAGRLEFRCADTYSTTIELMAHSHLDAEQQSRALWSFFFITLLNECVSGADSCFLLEVPVAI
jgi:hypothetical protein